MILPRQPVPDTVEVTVPAGGWKAGDQVTVTLPGEELQQVRVTISQQTAISAVPGLPFKLRVAEGGELYRVEFRGGCVDTAGCDVVVPCALCLSMHRSGVERSVLTRVRLVRVMPSPSQENKLGAT